MTPPRSPATSAASDEDKIIARLRQEALAGNVQAARELREWLKAKQERDQGASSIDTATTYSQLSQAQRDELRTRLLAHELDAMGARIALDVAQAPLRVDADDYLTEVSFVTKDDQGAQAPLLPSEDGLGRSE